MLSRFIPYYFVLNRPGSAPGKTGKPFIVPSADNLETQVKGHVDLMSHFNPFTQLQHGYVVVFWKGKNRCISKKTLLGRILYWILK